MAKENTQGRRKNEDGKLEKAQEEFVDKLVTQNAEVKAGDNKLELIVRENTLNTYTHSTGGPAIDCVKLVTDTGISWNPIKENLDHVGQIEG